MWGFFPFWESWNPSSLNCSSLEQCHALLCGLMHSSYSLWQPLAAVSWDQCVLRLGQLELPALHISGSYLNISPYLCFTEIRNANSSCGWNTQEKGWLCVPVCSASKDQGMVSVSAPSSASLNSNFVPQNAESPPSFIAAKLLLGVKWPGRFCYCYSALSMIPI